MEAKHLIYFSYASHTSTAATALFVTETSRLLENNSGGIYNI